MAEQLSGHWRAGHLFGLEQALKMYDSIEGRLQEHEAEILRRMKAVPPVRKPEKANLTRNAAQSS